MFSRPTNTMSGDRMTEKEITEMIKNHLSVRISVGSKVRVSLHWYEDDRNDSVEISSDYAYLPDAEPDSYG